jgi:hypothetical protein
LRFAPETWIGGLFIEVKINKEIRNFKESIFFGLSLRQFLCSLLAVGTSLGLFYLLNRFIGTSEVGWICVIGAAPFALIGFFRYQGLPLERVLVAWFRSQIVYPRKMYFAVTSALITTTRVRNKNRNAINRNAKNRGGRA